MGLLKAIRGKDHAQTSDAEPSERHQSSLYPELNELMVRNDRWAKRVASADPG
jgi:hypothetical protein